MQTFTLHPTSTVAGVRFRGPDAIRGAAILLMILDHVLVQVDPHSPLRAGSAVSITRLSLPLFMLAAAAVWKPGIGRRWKLAGVAAIELVAYGELGMLQPGIVAVFVLVLLLLDCAELLGLDMDRPYALAVVGLVQALYVPIGWDGYEPGLVLAWWALGRLWWTTEPRYRLPGAVALSWVGRHPLGWYVGHLAGLWLVFVVAS